MAHAEKPTFKEDLARTVELGAIVAGLLGLIGAIAISGVATVALLGIPAVEIFSRRKNGGGGH